MTLLPELMRRAGLVTAAVCIAALAWPLSASAKNLMNWENIATLPDPVGQAAPFAGVSGGALIVAGGANFPNGMPWEGGKKVWHDAIYVLSEPKGEWKSGFKLPRPNAYGVSITTDAGVLCIGGGDAQQHFAEVTLMKWEKGKIAFETFPSLPKPVAFACGALLDNAVYIAGGIETPGATNTLRTFWSLDLGATNSSWRELEPWPGAGRMLAVAAAQDGSFFLAGGADLSADKEGKPQRSFLRDGYRYTPGKGWKQIADLPRYAVAAPSPAPAVGRSSWLVFGGDDAAQLTTPPTEHRGFPREILAYDSASDKWSRAGEMPFALVTTSTLRWNGKVIVPGGEAKPGVRSPAIWSGTFK